MESLQPPVRGPRLTVGLPVYNGAPFLEETVRSLLVQTYADFELVISDNASTDGTREIVRRLEGLDGRIRSHRFDTNQGPAVNYNKLVDLAQGEDLFVWAAADDIHEPTFLEECVRALDNEPAAAVAYSRTKVIEQGQPDHDHGYEPDIDSSSVAERFRTLLSVDHRRHGAFEIFGVMRLNLLRDAGPMGSYARGDSVLLVRMALRGKFVRVPEYLFLNRNHPDRSVRKVPVRSYKGKGRVVEVLGSGPVPPDEWWDADKRNRIVWPEWKLLAQYGQATVKAPLTQADRRACFAVLTKYVIRNLPKLARDLLINLEYQLRRLITTSRQ